MRHPPSLCFVWVAWAFVILSESVFGQDARGPDFDRPARQSSSDLYSKVVAICVGIDDYESKGITDLSQAQRDAEGVAAVLRERFGYSVIELTEEAASREGILTALRTALEEADDRGAVLFYFAGHGQGVQTILDRGRLPVSEGFLIPQDAPLRMTDTRDVEAWRRHAISATELKDLANATRARHVLYMVDACYAGFLGKQSRSNTGARVDLLQLVDLKSRLAITAGTEDEVAFEDPELSQGVFTFALLEALARDHAQSVTEVFLSVREEVVFRSGRRQTPQLRPLMVENGEFVFVPRAVADLREAVRSAQRRLVQRGGWETTPEDVFEAYGAADPQFATNAEGMKAYWGPKVEQFRLNASVGHGLAMAGLSYCYRRGLGVEVDADLAYRWAQRGYHADHPAGIAALASCYEQGAGVVRNARTADMLRERAIDGGDPIAAYEQAQRYIEQSPQRLGDQDPVVALLERASISGLAEAKVVLARLFGEPAEGLKQDRDRALQLLREAARSGSAVGRVARFDLVARWGIGDDEEHSAALEDLRAAADEGLAAAQLRYGLLLLTGDQGVDRNPYRALQCFRTAADQGDPEAAFRLARCYAEGIGTRVDRNQAVSYLERAVEQDLLEANWYKGKMLRDGSLYPRDGAAGMQLLEQVARNSVEHAVRLADLLRGEGRPGAAYTWYRSASQRGSRAGKKGMVRISAQPSITAVTRSSPPPAFAIVKDESGRAYPTDDLNRLVNDVDLLREIADEREAANDPLAWWWYDRLVQRGLREYEEALAKGLVAAAVESVREADSYWDDESRVILTKVRDLNGADVTPWIEAVLSKVDELISNCRLSDIGRWCTLAAEYGAEVDDRVAAVPGRHLECALMELELSEEIDHPKKRFNAIAECVNRLQEAQGQGVPVTRLEEVSSRVHGEFLDAVRRCWRGPGWYDVWDERPTQSVVYAEASRSSRDAQRLIVEARLRGFDASSEFVTADPLTLGSEVVEELLAEGKISQAAMMHILMKPLIPEDLTPSYMTDEMHRACELARIYRECTSGSNQAILLTDHEDRLTRIADRLRVQVVEEILRVTGDRDGRARRDFEDAERVAAWCHRTFPKRPDFRVLLGVLLELEDRSDAAWELLRGAQNVHPAGDAARVYWAAARAASRTGRDEDARRFGTLSRRKLLECGCNWPALRASLDAL